MLHGCITNVLFHEDFIDISLVDGEVWISTEYNFSIKIFH